MLFEKDIVAACEERQLRLLRAAAKQRLLQQLPTVKVGNAQPGFLFAVGALLVRWGNWLQRQSAAPSVLRTT